MALTLNNFVGFETGGLEEVDNTTASPDATEATVVRSGDRSLRCDAGDIAGINVFDIVSDAGGQYVMGFGVRFTTLSPSLDSTFFLVKDDTGLISFRLVLEPDGDLAIFVQASVDTTISAPFTLNTWHYIEVRYEFLDSGVFKLWIDGIEKASLSGKDFKPDVNDLGRVEFATGGATDLTTYFDDFYFYSGSIAESDRLGDAEVFKYQSVKASATPDASALADTVLQSGTWDKAGETPLAETATNPEYTDTGAGVVYTNATNGSPQGPNNDARIEGDSNIKAMKGISSMKRSGGGGTDHFMHMGNDGGAASDLLKSADLNPTTAFDEFFLITESTTVMPKPDSSEHCAIGFEMTNAQDYECREQWAMLLHVPTTALTALSQADFPDQNYYIGPFHI